MDLHSPGTTLFLFNRHWAIHSSHLHLYLLICAFTLIVDFILTRRIRTSYRVDPFHKVRLEPPDECLGKGIIEGW